MTLTRALAGAVAIGAGAVGLWGNTWAVGGSDSSCYALMTQAFARGDLQPLPPLALEAPWPDATTTFAPGGFIPSPVRAGAASPVCAPGFALVLTPFYLAGGADAIFVVIPLAGAALVYLTYVLGVRVAGAGVGLAAAVLIACAPVFVFQIVQPMNDVLVAMLWTAVVVLAASDRKHEPWMGVVAGLAILVRPNLAPALLAVTAWCFWRGWRRLTVFVVAIAPFVVALALLNTALYGKPLQSGYGAMGGLFALDHVAANVRNYGRAIVATQLGLPVLGFAALSVTPRDRRAIVLLASGVAGAIIAVYLFYRPLPEWWYLRFWLPALPMLIVLSLAALMFVSRSRIALLVVAAVVGTYGAMSPAMQDALDLARFERRFRMAAGVARERLPENAVFVTVWESGSVRFHAEREALLWDSLDPASFDAALAWLSSRGREPYIMIEDWEEPAFRARFAETSAIGQLDWPPRFDIDRRVRIYRPADRAGYMSGASVPTEFVWPNRP